MPDLRHIDVNALLALATDRSREARAELGNAIADLFLPTDQRLTDQQRALMSDVLGRLLGAMEMEIRQQLAEALIRSPLDIPELEAQLPDENIELVRPILENSAVVRDVDLMKIVVQCAEEHRMAITLRESPSTSITEVLVEKGVKGSDDDVLETLIRNDDTVLSRRAMELLVVESKRNGQLQQPLLSRHDLPFDMAGQIYWWVSAILRRHILRNFVIDQTVLDPMLERSTKRAMAEHDENQSVHIRALQLARRLEELGELTDSFFMKTLRQGRLSLFAAGLSSRAKISFSTAWSIVTDRGHESFIVLAKAIELTRDATASMVLVLDSLNTALPTRPPSIINDILRLFDDLDVAGARRVLQYWQLDTDYQNAIDVISQDVG